MNPTLTDAHHKKMGIDYLVVKKNGIMVSVLFNGLNWKNYATRGNTDTERQMPLILSHMLVLGSNLVLCV